MMTLGQYIVFITFMIPAFSATVGGMLVALSVRYSLTAQEQSVKRLFFTYFSAMAFSWTSMFFFYQLPEAFVYTNALTMFSMSVLPVIFYHFFWLMVNHASDKRTRFNYWHYLAPVLISLVLLVWSLTVPADVRLEMIEGRRLFVPDGLEVYALLFFSKPEMNFLFGIIYMVLTIRLLLRYYVISEGNKYTLRKPQGWVLLLIGASLCVLPAAALGTILPRESAYASGAMMLSVGLLVMQNIVLTYAIVRRRFMLLSEELSAPILETEIETIECIPTEPTESIETEELVEPIETDVPPVPAEPEKKATSKLNKEAFDAFIRREKPFLNPYYLITDLADAFETNRTYVSNFINTTFGMNFSRYMNNLRLKELKRLLRLRANKGKSPNELLKEAGFTNPRQYNRVLSVEQSRKKKKRNQTTAE